MFAVQKCIPRKVEPAADVWALGAVFSEILVWTIGGEYFREDYCRRRGLEMCEFPSVKDSGYGGAFHNGESRLNVVKQIHDDALRTRPNDELSKAISDLILAHMLEIEDLRRKPIDIAKKLEYELRRLRRLPQSPGSDRISTQSPDLSATPVAPNDVILRRVTESSTSIDQGPSYAPCFTDDPQHLPSPIALVETTGLPSGSQDRFPRRQTVPGSLQPLGPPQGIQPQAAFGDLTGTPPINKINSLDPASSDLPEAVNVRRSETLRPPSVNAGASSFTLLVDQQGLSFRRAYGLLSRKQSRPHRSLTFKRIVESKESRKLSKAASEEMRLPGIQEALSTVESLGKREQVSLPCLEIYLLGPATNFHSQMILIDDFASMEKHKLEVQSAARVISYYVKEVDPNKMELYFASEINKPSEYDRSSALETAIQNHAFVAGQCSMRLYLGNILRNIMEKPTFRDKPSSIYVFTDAVWEPGNDRVDMVIAEAARRLSTEKLPPEHIMIQFIRFGDNEVGKVRLRHLDDDLVQDFQLGD